MVKEELYINDTLIPIENSINPSITYSIADIQEPAKRKTNFSKTIKIPNSHTANEVFSHAFEINQVDNTFNPSLKADMLFLVDGLENMRGYAQLKSINVLDNNDISYSVVLFGELGNLFAEVKDKYLNELDLSRFDHPFVEEAQRDSWDTQILENGGLVPFELGNGYVYPLIDYGYSSNGLDYAVYELGCAIYVKTYWDEIFSENGYTYESDFINSDVFKSLIIPQSPTAYALSAQEIQDRQFDADTPKFFDTDSTLSNTLPKESYSSARGVKFTNENDPNNLFSGFVFTVQDAGLCELSLSLDFNVIMYPDNVVDNTTASSEVRGNIYVYKNFVPMDSKSFYVSPLATAVGARNTNSTPSPNDLDYRQTAFTSIAGGLGLPLQTDPPNRLQLNIVDNLNVGDDIRVYYSAGLFKFPNKTNYFDVSGGGTSDGEARISCSIGSFSNRVVNQNIAVGTALNISKVIPTNIKQTDFLTSIINMFNLYIEPDKFNPKNLIIEPYNDYLREDIVRDWSEKHDISKPTVIKPISQAKALNYIFKYKDDKDYYNELYSSAWGVSYGEREVNSINEFLKGDKKTELIFSPTPLVANPDSPIVTPTIIGSDDLGQAIQTKHNIRIMYYGGLKGQPNGDPLITPWRHYDPLINFAWNRYYYPYAGHFDDPFNATLDINFGLVNEVYYDDTAGPITVTTDNLYNRYHSRFINNILDVNGKTLEGYFLLSPLDIYNLSFRELFYHNNAYWRLLKVSNYNPITYQPVKCEFLKVNADFNDGSIETVNVKGNREPIPNAGDGVNQLEYTPVKGNNYGVQKDGNSYNVKTTTIQGEDNYVNKTALNIEIQGDNNRVYSGTKNISLINSNGNTIESGVENVTLINTNDLTITESNSTYIDGVLQNKNIVYTNTSLTASEDVDIYLVDDAIITLPDAPTNKTKWLFKNYSGLNCVIVNATKLIDGYTKIDLFSINDTIEVVFSEEQDTYLITSDYKRHNDHHSGYNSIDTGEVVNIKSNKQMINYDGLAIDGDLNIIGDLILK